MCKCGCTCTHGAVYLGNYGWVKCDKCDCYAVAAAKKSTTTPKRPRAAAKKNPK